MLWSMNRKSVVRCTISMVTVNYVRATSLWGGVLNSCRIFIVGQLRIDGIKVSIQGIFLGLGDTAGMRLSISWIVSRQILSWTEPKRCGILHLTKKLYALMALLWKLRFHQAWIESAVTNSSISSQKTFVKFEQSLNASSWIFLMAHGITMLRSNVHSQNAWSPISSRPLQRITDPSCKHWAKVISFIAFIAGGLIISWRMRIQNIPHSQLLLAPHEEWQRSTLRKNGTPRNLSPWPWGGWLSHEVMCIHKCSMPNLHKPITKNHSIFKNHSCCTR